MKIKYLGISVISIFLTATLLLAGCKTGTITTTTSSVSITTTSVTSTVTQTDNYVAGTIPAGWQKTSLTYINSLIGQTLPLPSYLPDNYHAQEIWYGIDHGSSPQIVYVVILYSDDAVQWSGTNYRCRFSLNIDWNEPGAGFKQFWNQGERINSVTEGVLLTTNDEYNLYWENFSSSQGQSVYRISTSLQFPKDEILRIATSVPATTLSSTVSP
jgi:hypothetical protein